MSTEIKHFTLGSKEENTYGWPWNEVVGKYLEAGYDSDSAECELKIRDKEYKVLRRTSVTAFYDVNGNTLFDVENERLKEERERIVSAPVEATVNYMFCCNVTAQIPVSPIHPPFYHMAENTVENHMKISSVYENTVLLIQAS